MSSFATNLLACSSFLLLCIFPVIAQDTDENFYHSRKEAERRYLDNEIHHKIFRFFDSAYIDDHHEYDGHVVVVKGNLQVEGIVNGDILVIWGDVDLYSTAQVNGDITSIDGHIRLVNGARVSGNMLETRWRNLLDRNREFPQYFHRHFSDREDTFEVPHFEENFDLRYNRVEGAFFSVKAPRKTGYGYHQVNGYGFVGYGFESKDIRYQVGLDRWIFDPYDYRTEIGVEIHDLTDSKDTWRIGYQENSLAAFFLKQDYMDYFRRSGWSTHLSQNFTKAIKATVGYRRDDYRSLESRTNWALFNDSRSFRLNPALGEDEGDMRSIYGQIEFDTRDDCYENGGLALQLSAESSYPELGGDFDFQRYTAQLIFRERSYHGSGLSLRMMAGTSVGDLPFQKNFELGGISTLRGFAYKAFRGNRLFLTNIEYRLDSGVFGDIIPIDDINFIIFGDIGDAWNGSENENWYDSFRPLTWRGLKSDIGVGIADKSGSFRLNFAKRTDRDQDILVTLRLQHPF